MTSRLDTRSLDTRSPRPAAPPATADPGHPRCERGGLDAVITGSDLATAASHLSECMSCQAQFLSQGGLLPVPERATGPLPDGPAGHTAPARP
jgi:hypothetical protein